MVNFKKKVKEKFFTVVRCFIDKYGLIITNIEKFLQCFVAPRKENG